MKKFLKRFLLGTLVLLVIFISYVLIVTMNMESKQITVDAIEAIEIPDSAVDHFAESIRIKTVTPENPEDFDSTQFRQMGQFLTETYPLIDSLLDKNVFNEFSFLYKWPGSKADLKPIMLYGHLDVVAVPEGNLPDWKHDPFGGELINDTVWGRGSIDDKNQVIAMMEATEMLLREGFRPERTVYLAMGHDEENGGFAGAKAIGDYLRSQNFEAEYILDEGGCISKDLIPDMDKPVAMIGVAEKGFLSVKMEVKIEGGHSSMPAPETAIDVLTRAITKLVDNPFPARISPAIQGFIEYMGPELSFLKKAVFANSNIFGSLIISAYEEKNSGNALVRTTIAPTIIDAGIKDNVIPQTASATVNFRILTGESIESTLDRVKEIIDDDRITYSIYDFQSEPSPISSDGSFGFKTLHHTIAEIYPKALVTPYLMVGGTDSRHFPDLSPNIYRFNPIKLDPDNIKSFHGLNEHLAVSEFKDCVRFYLQLIRNSTGPESS